MLQRDPVHGQGELAWFAVRQQKSHLGDRAQVERRAIQGPSPEAWHEGVEGQSYFRPLAGFGRESGPVGDAGLADAGIC